VRGLVQFDWTTVGLGVSKFAWVGCGGLLMGTLSALATSVALWLNAGSSVLGVVLPSCKQDTHQHTTKLGDSRALLEPIFVGIVYCHSLSQM